MKLRPDRQEIELEDALAHIALTTPIAGVETLPLHLAHNRILAVDVVANTDHPPFARSPLDGYALHAEDIALASPDAPAVLTVVDRICAGGVPACAVARGQATRIMTGAVMPDGANAVVRQESTDYGDETVAVYHPLRPGDNVCLRGEDFFAGSVLVSAGTKLNAAALGVIASGGVAFVSVRVLPRVALMVTGDELAAPDTDGLLPPGKIYSSNFTMLSARLVELGFAPVLSVQLGDDPQVAAQWIADALPDIDVLITTGGVSVGDQDLFHEVMPLVGAGRVFHGVNLKPGTPAMFSQVDGVPVLSLSGNPFAAAATFELLARPLLAAVSGDLSILPRCVLAPLDTAFAKQSAARRFVRGTLLDGRVSLPAGHASGQLRSFLGCNCLVEIAPGAHPQIGDVVTVHLM